MSKMQKYFTNLKIFLEHLGPVVNLESLGQCRLEAIVCILRSYDWADKVLTHLAGASQSHNGDALRVTHLGT